MSESRFGTALTAFDDDKGPWLRVESTVFERISPFVRYHECAGSGTLINSGLHMPKLDTGKSNRDASNRNSAHSNSRSGVGIV